jgi:molybdopterin-containing oxidoreductase family membrane subunit
MANEPQVMGIFDSEDVAAATVRDLRDSPYALRRVHSPIPSHKLERALKLKKSPVGWFTLGGGITGFFTGFLLAAFTAVRWELIVSGKPIVALVPFLIVGFEFTVLFAVFGNIIGFLVLTKLPRYQDLTEYDERLSGEHFGVVAACEGDQVAQLEAFFRERGGDARVFTAA